MATKSGEVTCRGVRVAVKNTDVNVFVDEEDVMKAIKKVRRHYGQKYIGGE
ncbi:MAG: hypothetical protein ACLU4J_27490 [Butyricimonas paravirosa]